MISRSIVVFIVLLFPFWLLAQEEIEVVYDHISQDFVMKSDITVLEAGEQYRLKILNINPVYIQDHIRIRSYRYISPTPEILNPLFPEVPDNNVYSDLLGVNSSGQREFFLNAFVYFDKLELLRSESDDLYARTRWNPDKALATTKLDKIDSVFDNAGFQETVSKIIYYQDYILAAESVYKTNIKKVTLKTPDADIVLREYARITRIADKIKSMDYVHMLDYIVRSTTAIDYILSDVFKGEKDVTDIHMALYDSYIHHTIHSETLTFHTGQNWSFDFSTGFFYTSLYDKDYYLTGQDGEPGYILEEKKFKGDISIGALAHYTFKPKPGLRLGPSIGASISPFDGNIRYLMGISAFAGSGKIVGINAGISLGQVDVLSGGVDTDNQGPYLPDGVNKIPTYTKTKAGFFIGLSYNLTRTKKQ